MAGVIADFKYTDDGGTIYKFRGDKSNNLAVGNDPAVAADNLTYIPRNFTMRYLLCSAINPVGGKAPLTRKIPVADVSGDIWGGVTTTVALDVVGSAAPVAFTITARRGEQMSLMADLP